MKAADGVPFQFWTGGPSTALRDPWRKQMINIDASHHVTFATRIAMQFLKDEVGMRPLRLRSGAL